MIWRILCTTMHYLCLFLKDLRQFLPQSACTYIACLPWCLSLCLGHSHYTLRRGEAELSFLQPEPRVESRNIISCIQIVEKASLKNVKFRWTFGYRCRIKVSVYILLPLMQLLYQVYDCDIRLKTFQFTFSQGLATTWTLLLSNFF